MLTILDFFLTASLVVLLISIAAENASNTKLAVKIQAYATIVGLAIESISLVVRFFWAGYWFPVLCILVAHSLISIGVFTDAKDYGVFERKKKSKQNVDVNVVV